MSSFLLGIALKYVLPTVLSYLAKYGHDEAVKLLSSKSPAQIVDEVKSIPTTAEFPSEDSKGQGLTGNR